MELAPITLRDFRRFVAEHHRHAKPPLRTICQVALVDDGKLIGVASLEYPKARMLCDGKTAEISRVCTLGTKNACSMLYGAMTRAAKALGYRRVVTYTLSREAGASVRAAGFCEVATVPPSTWSRRHINAKTHQPSMFFEKYGKAEERIRWERQL